MKQSIMEHKIRFCYDNCRFLNPTESDQDKMGHPKMPHFCELYKKQVKHSGHHPKLVMLDECAVNVWCTKPEIDKYIKDLKNLKKMSSDEFMKEYCVVFKPDDKIDPKMSKELTMGIDLASPGTSDISVTRKIFPVKK